MSFTEILDILFTPVRLCIDTLLKNETIKNTVFNGQADLFQVLIGFLLIALLISAVLRPVRLPGGLFGGIVRLMGSVEHINNRATVHPNMPSSPSSIDTAKARMADKQSTVLNARK